MSQTAAEMVAGRFKEQADPVVLGLKALVDSYGVEVVNRLLVEVGLKSIPQQANTTGTQTPVSQTLPKNVTAPKRRRHRSPRNCLSYSETCTRALEVIRSFTKDHEFNLRDIETAIKNLGFRSDPKRLTNILLTNISGIHKIGRKTQVGGRGRAVNIYKVIGEVACKRPPKIKKVGISAS